MGKPETLSIKARLRISILVLVTVIILTLSFLHLDGVIGQTLSDDAERARLIGDQIRTYVWESSNRQVLKARASSLDEQKRIRYEFIRTDPILPRLLEKSLGHSDDVVEVHVLDENNDILASSTVGKAGQHQPIGNTVAEWERLGSWGRLLDLFRSNADYTILVPAGEERDKRHPMTIQVLLSPELIKESVMPKVYDLAVVSGGALAMSILLAMLVSQLFSRSLEHIVRRIDSISEGDTAGGPETFDTPEILNVDSKLALLGKQYKGAQSDFLNLRSNLDQMIANIEEVVLVFGPDGRLQIAGAPAERLLGKSRQETLGQTVDDIFPTWTDVGRLLNHAITNKQSFKARPAVFERPNLPAIRLLVNLEWLNYGQEREGMLLTMRDAESRRELVSQLDIARRLSAINRVMSGVAHEIKNPLNAIMLHLELADSKLDGASTAPTGEFAIIKRELIRLDRVVKTFLDFNSPLEMRLSDCNLVDVANETAAFILPQAKAKSVEVTSSHRVEHAPISADSDLLKQAVLNVLTNAVESMVRPGKVLITVEHVAGDYVLEVDDEGEGIAPEIQDKVFNLYFTTKPSGSGIGLSMAYKVVQLHGGTINFETVVGKGTCFRLRFPVKQPTDVAA